ncbi:hypothetical protein NXZ98_17660, partial [Escherichia coli]|nr:hypothetical protein [Escherichia coli]
VRPDSDRQLLAHPPVSAEPAGAVSGCRYGPMRENPTVAWCVKRRTGCATENLWISQIFSGEPDMYILRRDTPIMIVSYQGWSGGHAACPLHSPE